MGQSASSYHFPTANSISSFSGMPAAMERVAWERDDAGEPQQGGNQPRADLCLVVRIAEVR